MKILSFSYCFPNQNNPSWGVFVYQRLAALAQLEEVNVCAPTPWFPVVTPNVGCDEAQLWQALNVYRPSFFYFPGVLKNSDAYFYARGLKNWLRKLCQVWRPDVLDVHFVWPDGVGVGLLAKKMGIPYVITLRGKIYECLQVPSQTRQCANALQGAAAVISVSSKMADEARKLGVAPERLHVITNGVDKERFFPKNKKECRSLLGLPEDGRLMVTVAHLGHRKGHHEVLHALSHLPKDVKLVIVGGAAQGGTPEKLQEVARSVGVADRLILSGRQPFEKIPLYYNAANVSVLASYREGCPNAVLESLASGTPVVATDVGAVPDILPAPEVGRVVPAEQVEPLKQALSEVLESEWNADDVVQMSKVRDWQRVAEEVREVFRRIV